MAKYLRKQEIKWNVSTPIPPLLQLLVVLPPQSSYLVPKPFQKIMTGKLYPLEFQQDFINKRKYWQGIPQLPSIDLKHIYGNYKKYYNELPPNQVIKNKPQSIHLFGFARNVVKC
jgi:5'-3' exonuclease